MEAIKDNGKMKIITFDGYKCACFPNTKDSKKALEVIEKEKLDVAILSTPIDPKEDLGHTLHFVTYKTTVNVKRLVQLLIDEGKKNDLYWRHNGVQSQKSARVHSANIKLIK